MELAKVFAFHRVFNSHMVLQRDRKIVLSGTADPGKYVEVAFDRTKKSAKAGKDGEWSVSFPALPAGKKAHKITLSGAKGSQKTVLEDVLMGEVWICSGQSNMEMPVDSDSPFWFTKNAKEEVKNADYPEIRLLNVSAVKTVAPNKPEKEIPATEWTACTPETVVPFSACGYFFGRKLHQDLKVPVGLISASWGGTNIEAWISKNFLKSGRIRPAVCSPEEFEALKKEWKNIMDSNGDFQNWLADFEKTGKMPAEWLNPEFNDSDWETVLPSCEMKTPGRYCLRLHFNLPEKYAGKAASLNLGVVNDTDITYLNGQEIGRTQVDTMYYYAAQRNYGIAKGLLRKGENVLTVVGDNHFGAGNFALCPTLVFGKETKPLACTGKFKAAFILPETAPVRPGVPTPLFSGPNDPNYPSTLYNSMLAPLAKFGIRGYIWYQGCNNSGQMNYYYYHKLLIENVRADRNDPKMPFLLVQLAGFDNHMPDHRQNDETMRNKPFVFFQTYALTREIQAEMPKIFKNVGMASAFDIGDHSDIHPRDKQTLGLRLALKAESMIYGKKVVCDGPEVSKVSIDGRDVRIDFKNVGSGLITTDGKPPRGFWCVDRNGVVFPVRDAVLKRNSVSFTATLVPEAIRYAFTGWCDVNLANKEGFPALPFRTDKPDYQKMFE